MPTRREIRDAIAAHGAPGGEIGDDEPLHLDSLAMTWLLHVLEERHDIRIEPDDARLAAFTSVAAIERAVGTIAAASERA